MFFIREIGPEYFHHSIFTTFYSFVYYLADFFVLPSCSPLHPKNTLPALYLAMPLDNCTSKSVARQVTSLIDTQIQARTHTSTQNNHHQQYRNYTFSPRVENWKTGRAGSAGAAKFDRNHLLSLSSSYPTLASGQTSRRKKRTGKRKRRHKITHSHWNFLLRSGEKIISQTKTEPTNKKSALRERENNNKIKRHAIIKRTK